jgi:hypothetical protein
LPCLALGYFEQAARPVGRSDVTRDVLLIGQHDAATAHAEKVDASLRHMPQALHNTAARLAQCGEPAQAGSEGVGVNRHSRSDSRVLRTRRLVKLC